MDGSEGVEVQAPVDNEVKQQVWDAKTAYFSEVTDRLAQPIDEGIKDMVVGLSAFGYPTTGSCEGHVDYPFDEAPNKRRFSLPYVFVSEETPTYRYTQQREIFEKAAADAKLTPEEVTLRSTPEGNVTYLEAIKVLDADPAKVETEEYKAYREKNRIMAEKLKGLIAKFYASQPLIPEDPIDVEQISDGTVAVVTKGAFMKVLDDERPETSDDELNKTLAAQKKEMAAFSAFLKKEYFSQSSLPLKAA